MKKVLVIILVFMALTFGIKAQNLVPNYSFEDTIMCVFAANQFQGYVSNWLGVEAGLCYLTSECNESQDSVPQNLWGYQLPHSGHAYAGIYTFVDDTAYGHYISNNTNFRDYLQDTLLSSLKTGNKYYVTFYVSLADSSWYYCGDIGAYFSDSLLNCPVYTHAKPYILPQVANNPITNPLSDTKNWMKISGSFIAKGGEKYIAIGNFKNDSMSHDVYKGYVSTSPISGAYYYIDDVIVTTDSNYADSLFDGVSELKVEREKVKVWPNPVNSLLNIEIESLSGKPIILNLYNSMGQKVEALELQQTFSQVSLGNLPAGIYDYRITDESSNLIKADKVMVIH